MCAWRCGRSVLSIAIALYLCSVQSAECFRTSHDLTKAGKTDAAELNGANEAAAKPLWKKMFGAKSKFQVFDVSDVLARFGVEGTEIALLLPGEKVDTAYKRGANNLLLFTSKRLILIERTKTKGKLTYTSWMWPHIARYEIDTKGSFEVGGDTELLIEVPHCLDSMRRKFKFSGVDIVEVGNYISKQMLIRDGLTPNKLPIVDGLKPYSFTAKDTGRLNWNSVTAYRTQKHSRIALKNLVTGEDLSYVFSYNRRWSHQYSDYLLITNKRIVTANRQGASKNALASTPFIPNLQNGVTCFGVTTAANFDSDSEMFVDLRGVGRSYAEFVQNIKIAELYKSLTAWVLGYSLASGEGRSRGTNNRTKGHNIKRKRSKFA